MAAFTREERASVDRYRLGNTVIYNSEASKRLIDQGMAHNDGTAGGAMKGIAMFALASLRLNITVASLERGQHIECKTLEELMAAENALMTACRNLQSYLDTAATFDGRSVLFDFRTGEPVAVAAAVGAGAQSSGGAPNVPPLPSPSEPPIAPPDSIFDAGSSAPSPSPAAAGAAREGNVSGSRPTPPPPSEDVFDLADAARVPPSANGPAPDVTRPVPDEPQRAADAGDSAGATSRPTTPPEAPLENVFDLSLAARVSRDAYGAAGTSTTSRATSRQPGSVGGATAALNGVQFGPLPIVALALGFVLSLGLLVELLAHH